MADPFNETDAVRAEWFKQHGERSATKSDDAGHIPQLEPDGYLHGGFVRHRYDVPTFFPVDASATPQAVLIDTDGTLLLGKADITTRAKFAGFLFEDYSGQTPAEALTRDEFTNSGQSFTLDAGTDRVLYVTFLFTTTSGAPTMPDTVEWNGHTLTKVPGSEVTTTDVGIAVWRYIAGDDVSSETGNLVYSGQSGTNLIQHVFVDPYQYVDQASPEDDVDTSTDGGGSSIDTAVTAGQSYSMAIHAVANRSGNAITLDPNFTQRQLGDTSRVFGDGYLTVAEAKTLTDTYSAGSNTAAVTILLKNSVSTEAKLIYGGILPGFSGLTPGIEYYLSDTAGAISTTPGSTEVRVGKAVSPTELLIIH